MVGSSVMGLGHTRAKAPGNQSPSPLICTHRNAIAPRGFRALDKDALGAVEYAL
jgi:hypothetical protein